jgi:hypothetical protein
MHPTELHHTDRPLERVEILRSLDGQTIHVAQRYCLETGGYEPSLERYALAHGWRSDGRGSWWSTARAEYLYRQQAARQEAEQRHVDGGSPAGRLALAQGSHSTPNDGRTAQSDSIVMCPVCGETISAPLGSSRWRHLEVHGWKGRYCSDRCSIVAATRPQPMQEPVTTLAGISGYENVRPHPANVRANPQAPAPAAEAKARKGRHP